MRTKIRTKRKWREEGLRILVASVLGVLALGSIPAFSDNVVLQLSAEDQQMLAAKLGPGVVGKALPSKAVDPLVYFPLQEKTLTYLVTSGPNAGSSQTLGLAKLRRPGGTSAWRFQLSPILAGFIRATP